MESSSVSNQMKLCFCTIVVTILLLFWFVCFLVTPINQFLIILERCTLIVHSDVFA